MELWQSARLRLRLLVSRELTLLFWAEVCVFVSGDNDNHTLQVMNGGASVDGIINLPNEFKTAAQQHLIKESRWCYQWLEETTASTGKPVVYWSDKCTFVAV